MSNISKKKMASKQKWDMVQHVASHIKHYCYLAMCLLQIRDRFESFVPYIEEDRTKKYETLQKYKMELMELNKKEQELQKLKMELELATKK